MHLGALSGSEGVRRRPVRLSRRHRTINRLHTHTLHSACWVILAPAGVRAGAVTDQAVLVNAGSARNPPRLAPPIYDR